MIIKAKHGLSIYIFVVLFHIFFKGLRCLQPLTVRNPQIVRDCKHLTGLLYRFFFQIKCKSTVEHGSIKAAGAPEMFSVACGYVVLYVRCGIEAWVSDQLSFINKPWVNRLIVKYCTLLPWRYFRIYLTRMCLF
jgi:hypothetical protein